MPFPSLPAALVCAACAVLLLAPRPALSATPCSEQRCQPGWHVVSAASRDNFYYACPTRALSDYSNTVVGLVILRLRLGAHFPPASTLTGEPDYPEPVHGMIDALRREAHVLTLSQALAACHKGPDRARLVVLESTHSGSIRVARPGGKPFWMPEGHVYRR